MALLPGTVFHDQQKYTGQEPFGGIIEKRILPIAGRVRPGADDGLGRDLGILLCPGLVCQVLRILQPQIHVFIHHPQDVVPIGTCGVSKIQDGYFVAVVFFCDPCIIPEQVSFGIRAEKTHTAGTGILDTGIEKVCRFPYTGSTDHQKMDVSGIDQGSDTAMGEFSSYHDALGFRQVLSLPPQLRLVWDMGIGSFDLRICGKAGRPILAVPDCFGFDPVQVIMAGQEHDQSQQGEHPQPCTYQDHNLCCLHLHTPLYKQHLLTGTTLSCGQYLIVKVRLSAPDQ